MANEYKNFKSVSDALVALQTIVVAMQKRIDDLEAAS